MRDGIVQIIWRGTKLHHTHTYTIYFKTTNFFCSYLDFFKKTHTIKSQMNGNKYQYTKILVHRHEVGSHSHLQHAYRNHTDMVVPLYTSNRHHTSHHITTSIFLYFWCASNECCRLFRPLVISFFLFNNNFASMFYVHRLLLFALLF